jgi:hypothetical protein
MIKTVRSFRMIAIGLRVEALLIGTEAFGCTVIAHPSNFARPTAPTKAAYADIADELRQYGVE